MNFIIRYIYVLELNIINRIAEKKMLNNNFFIILSFLGLNFLYLLFIEFLFLIKNKIQIKFIIFLINV